MAYFDNYGWYTIEVLVDRVAGIEPANTSITDVDGELRSNWTGNEWVNIPYKKFEYVETIQVPQTITPRQIRMQLTNSGLRQQVEDMVANSNDYALKDWWEYSLDYKRDNPILIGMATQLGLTEEQLDNMFIEASKL